MYDKPTCAFKVTTEPSPVGGGAHCAKYYQPPPRFLDTRVWRDGVNAANTKAEGEPDERNARFLSHTHRAASGVSMSMSTPLNPFNSKHTVHKKNVCK